MLSPTMTPKVVESGSEDDAASSQTVRTPQKSNKPTGKARSLSDSSPRLEPSPKFREPLRTSRDDHTIIASPRTPRRPELLSRGLSLQMPPREVPMPSPAHFAARVPLSPQLDARNTYASPTSLLPRRSRGAEFSRACTNLHHSTLADQSSPDSSPTITQKGMMIPSRRPRGNSMVLDSPNVMHSVWGNGDRTAASSSMGSISMLDPDDSSSSSDDGDPMDGDDNEDPMLTTPQAMKQTTPFGGPLGGNPGTWSNMFSPGGVPTFMSIQRARLRKGRSRKSSSSASGHSSMGMASPGPASPPNGKEGYFAREAVKRKANSISRRESLSLFTNDLHISSGNDSGDEGMGMPQTPGVVRRPVTRRGNLLPKSRQFGRIKAELWEESAPIDNEFRREAEIIRQVRESEESIEFPSATAQSSPSLLPSVPGLDGPLEGVPEEESESNLSLDGSTSKGLFSAFMPPKNINTGGGKSLWDRDVPAQTPPPPTFPRAGSSVVSEDMNMESPSTSSLPSNAKAGGSEQSRSATPQPLAPPLTAVDGLKKSNKRRRDDDLDGYSIKRRAVSPGLSVHNSPVMSQSPAQGWGRAQREPSVSGGHAAGERSNSGGSVAVTPSLGPKRVGLQSMTDTHDGLMKMSIE
ncbi:hypothetical protein P280DRAFT_301732 [Massarina eburnea CBS 473.64]|uniref:Uncharacterized protein n=1 Tax=Massarina eburnea CBS 473.64 TaxID=1395130 RepID=A0A6A6RZT4_9PLEO|nr:hypothetical protein P280DRAFT_301732 [Massarina eburnea CBS 473.64]